MRQVETTRQEPAQPQGGGQRPTVGDTVSVVHRIAAPPAALVQPRAPLDSSLATLLGPPDVSREGDSVRIAYTLTVWAAGEHDLVLPGAIIVAADGRVDTLPDARLRLDVASVLPPNVRAESVLPQAAQPWVPRADRSLLPYAILLPAVLLVVLVAVWAWRRRGPLPAPSTAVSAPPVDRDRLMAWCAAGEAALVIDHLLAQVPAEGEWAAWRENVAAVRFTPASSAALDRLAREGLARLGAGEGTT